MDRSGDPTIGVIGLGYVGLPLAVEFGAILPTVGLDIDARRISELSEGHDRTREVSAEELRAAKQLKLTCDREMLRQCDIFIVTVPTPVDEHKQPDLTPLRLASEMIGAVIKPGAIVVYESTVYPGATEEECIPVIERMSSLQYNRDFFAGYSPERINPGDKQHRLVNIKKITSGSTPEVAEKVDNLYRRIIKAGTHLASSIRVAEAAKVIENTQRDVNIALINELALIFERLGIDTLEVLEASGTKWNFLPFRPGLVGGHCIGVDPYYLTYKAQALGYQPEVVLAGRRINDNMGAYLANRLIKAMVLQGRAIKGSRVLMLGLTFKEDCPDLRNTRVVDIVAELRSFGVEVDVADPHVSPPEAEREYGLTLVEPQSGTYDAMVVAVAHSVFRDAGPDQIRSYGRPGSLLFDVKGIFPRQLVDMRL